MFSRETQGQFALSLLNIKLRQAYPNAPALEDVTAKRLYKLVLDGRIPAEQVRGRWFVAERNLPLIAEVLGIAPAAAAKNRAPGRRSTTVAAPTAA